LALDAKRTLLKQAAGQFDLFVTLDRGLQLENPIHDHLGVRVVTQAVGAVPTPDDKRAAQFYPR
jgi:hypothetical protein